MNEKKNNFDYNFKRKNFVGKLWNSEPLQLTPQDGYAAHIEIAQNRKVLSTSFSKIVLDETQLKTSVFRKNWKKTVRTTLPFANAFVWKHGGYIGTIGVQASDGESKNYRGSPFFLFSRFFWKRLEAEFCFFYEI